MAKGLVLPTQCCGKCDHAEPTGRNRIRADGSEGQPLIICTNTECLWDGIERGIFEGCLCIDYKEGLPHLDD